MKKILFAILALMLVLVSASAMAVVDEPEGFNYECQNFYDDESYFTIEKWMFNDVEGDYVLMEQSSLYGYYEIDVTGDLHNATWISHRNFNSLLVVAGDETSSSDEMTPANIFMFGGWTGDVSSEEEITHLTFCGKRSTGSSDSSTALSAKPQHGVPEFPSLALGVVLLFGTLSIVALRKK